VVIVDTTVWVDYLQGAQDAETEWLDQELDRQRLALTDVIFCEVVQGLSDDVIAEEVEDFLLRFEIFATGGVDLAREAARN
jgi:predicted nucleic acid-binding protein